VATIRSFEELECWQAARELARAVYCVTRSGIFAKDFDLKDQLRRAAISVVSNIAKGYERDTRPERLRFLSIGKASAGEVRAQLYIASDLHAI
jgi:four helix bundle protein